MKKQCHHHDYRVREQLVGFSLLIHTVHYDCVCRSPKCKKGIILVSWFKKTGIDAKHTTVVQVKAMFARFSCHCPQQASLESTSFDATSAPTW